MRTSHKHIGRLKMIRSQDANYWRSWANSPTRGRQSTFPQASPASFKKNRV